jgi:ubiquinone/menaquinone biosynthesis C-methylase UbiE
MKRDRIKHVLENLLSRRPAMQFHDVYFFLSKMETESDFTKNYEQIAQDYKGRDPSIETETLATIAQLEMTDRTGVLLDLGCGPGFVLDRVFSTAPHLVTIGLDLAVTNLLQTSNDHFKMVANAEDVPLNASSVDYVICFDLLEHVQDMKKVAQEIFRVLKPGGELMLAFPYGQDLSVYETKEYKEKYGRYKYVHLRSINAHDVKAQFPGFTVKSSTVITAHKRFQEIKPYDIRYMKFIKAEA